MGAGGSTFFFDLGSPYAYLAAERMLIGEFVDYEAERHLEIAASAGTAEAFRAFVEKRKPVFR